MLKRLIVLILFIAPLALACVGTYLVSRTSDMPAQIARKYPWLESPLKGIITTGATLSDLGERFHQFSQSPVLTTSVRVVGQTADNLKNDLGRTLFPDDKTRSEQKRAQQQLQRLDQDLARKSALAKQLQDEIAQMETQRKTLARTANPLKKYEPDLGGFNMLNWFSTDENKGTSANSGGKTTGARVQVP